jgi:sec-independent protein translocase protein TatB
VLRRRRSATPWCAAAKQPCYRGAVFGIGSTELIVIAVVALMLFSPRELPKILRSVAKFWGSLRATADEFRDAIMNEEELEELKGVYRGTQAKLRQAESAARREMMKARMDMRRAQQKLAAAARASEDARKEEEAEKMEATSGNGEPVAAAPALGGSDGGTPAPSPGPSPATETSASPDGKGMSQGAA